MLGWLSCGPQSHGEPPLLSFPPCPRPASVQRSPLQAHPEPGLPAPSVLKGLPSMLPAPGVFLPLPLFCAAGGGRQPPPNTERTAWHAAPGLLIPRPSSSRQGPLAVSPGSCSAPGCGAASPVLLSAPRVTLGFLPAGSSPMYNDYWLLSKYCMNKWLVHNKSVSEK